MVGSNIQKYVCFKDFKTEVERIETFSRNIDHDVFARRHCCVNTDELAISAGFVTEEGICYGESMTLEIRSREEVDTEILRKQLQQIGGE